MCVHVQDRGRAAARRPQNQIRVGRKRKRADPVQRDVIIGCFGAAGEVNRVGTSALGARWNTGISRQVCREGSESERCWSTSMAGEKWLIWEMNWTSILETRVIFKIQSQLAILAPFCRHDTRAALRDKVRQSNVKHSVGSIGLNLSSSRGTPGAKNGGANNPEVSGRSSGAWRAQCQSGKEYEGSNGEMHGGLDRSWSCQWCERFLPLPRQQKDLVILIAVLCRRG